MKNNKLNFNRKQKQKIKPHRTLRFWFIRSSFTLFAITAAIILLVFVLLRLITVIDEFFANSTFVFTVTVAASCIVIGTAISVFSSNQILKKLNKISDGMKEISKGNFKVRVKETDRADTPSEFGELERTFNQMASDLDGLELFRNDFINNFSHEFKTPIVSIRGFARQLQSENLSEETKREYVDIILSESERLSNMSSNILLLTKLENQQIVTEKTRFQLDEQIRKSILLLEKEWSEKDISFELDDLEETEYEFNEEMLSHLWINLISNAIKFTRNGGTITVTAEQRDGIITVSVKDDGIGMSEETKSRIFEKFYQADTSHSGKGNGIGLNIAHRIVTLARGEIQVESKLGEGSEFIVRLPI